MISLDFLKDVDIFKGVNEKQLVPILETASRTSLKAGNRIFEEGEDANHIWIVSEGRVDLRFDLPGHRASTEISTIASVSVKETVGWSSFVPPYKYRLSAYCAGYSSEVLQVEKEQLVDLMDDDYHMGYMIMRNLATIISSRLHQLQKAALEPPVAKVKIKVHMATCGIAAGARGVMSAIMDELAGSDYQHIHVERAGCIGKCSTEPNITVEIDGENPITYKEMTSEKMRKIFKRHILGGVVQSDFILE